jgi:hypothetical protein
LLKESRRSPEERTEYRRQLAEDLAKKIMPPGDLFAFAVDDDGVVDLSPYYASMLMLEAEPSNHFIADRVDRLGNPYVGGSVGYRPCLRISPTYSQELARRNKREAMICVKRCEQTLTHGQRYAMREHPDWKGTYRWRFITLTMWHPEGCVTLAEVQRFNRAFTRLRKRPIWKKFRGNVKRVEDDLIPTGSHVHGHFLALSRWIDKDALRIEWEKCLANEGRPRKSKNNPKFRCWTKEVQAEKANPRKDTGFVKIQLVSGMKKNHFDGPNAEKVSLDYALSELCKYFTKFESLLEADEEGRIVSRETLIGLCDVPRWPRMFEAMGMCRDSRQSREARLNSIRPEYSSALKMGSMEKIETVMKWYQDLVDVDVETDVIWHIGPDDTIEYGEREHPPPLRKRPASATWRELMRDAEPELWLQIITERAKKQRENREGFLKRQSWGAVITLST